MMKQRNLVYTLFIVILVGCFTSCKSTKQLSGGVDNNKEEMSYMEKVIASTPNIESLSSKMKLSIRTGGKDISVNGTLKMKANEVIQLSVAPFLGIEVAKIEITKDSILFLDRMNKQYVYLPISALSSLVDTDMDFYTLQSLFFNQLFLPGNRCVTSNDVAAFTVQKEETQSLIQIKKAKMFDYRFVTTVDASQLVESSIMRNGQGLNWKYTNFQTLAGRNFPTVMNLSVAVGKQKIDAEISLSRLTGDSNWSIRTDIPRKYTQIDMNELLKRLLSL
ncbi:MAG: DUF4292 domain-containing protein [Bacteroidaceae bacterium]